MRSATNHVSISTARADALFASALQRSDDPSAAQVRQAIAAAIRAFGAQGCAAGVAQAYGEHPEASALWMRWARAIVTGDGGPGGAFGGARPAPARAAAPGQRTVASTCRAACAITAARPWESLQWQRIQPPR